jgi:hypothetical protein
MEELTLLHSKRVATLRRFAELDAHNYLKPEQQEKATPLISGVGNAGAGRKCRSWRKSRDDVCACSSFLGGAGSLST